ncbi:MAG: metallophosphoesterase [Phycisphaerae bacterium]
MNELRPQPAIAAAMRHRPLERAMLHRRWVRSLVRGAGAVGLTALVWPRFMAPYRCQIKRYAMPLRGIGEAFRGYRILHLTDLHTGRTRQKYLKRVIKQCMALEPNLIVITGDLIHYHPDSPGLLAELLPLLKAPDGVLATLGNHDYNEYSSRYTGARSARRTIHRRLRALLAQSQVRMMLNQASCIKRGDDELWLVGIDDFWSPGFNPAAAFAQAPANAVGICLEHNPDALTQVRDFQWQWMLCGHSHGGQVHVPLLGPMYVPMQHRNWLRGMFKLDSTAGEVSELGSDRDEQRSASSRAIGRGDRIMYVSCGLGYTAPFRMFAPPEAALFELLPL